MKVYLIKETPGNAEGADDLKLIKVEEEQDEAFLKEYESRIVLVGNSIQDVLIKFSLLINNQ